MALGFIKKVFTFGKDKPVEEPTPGEALAPAEAPELQVRHARPRAKEDEQDLASQLAGTAKV